MPPLQVVDFCEVVLVGTAVEFRVVLAGLIAPVAASARKSTRHVLVVPAVP